MPGKILDKNLLSDFAKKAINPDTKPYFDLLARIGKGALHALYPSDFEIYIISFELVDFQGNMVDFLTFPIMPKSISESEPQLTNIKKTVGGITAFSTSTFVPITIKLSGNFGKRFKFLIGRSMIDSSAISFTTKFKDSKSTRVFSNSIKTGYGCCKILKQIIEKSRKIDNEGNPYRLYFYNLAFGTSYLVKPIGELSFSMSLDSNMIWDYDLTLKAIAPLYKLRDRRDIKKSLVGIMSKAAIAKGIDVTNKLVKNKLVKLKGQDFDNFIGGIKKGRKLIK